MAYKLQRTDKEIDDTIAKAADAENDGVSKVPGMSYESGVKAALEWVLGEGEDNPMDLN